MNLSEMATIHKEAIIPDGTGKKTPAVELEYGNCLVGIYHPAIDTSTAFTFEASIDGITFVPVENGSGAAYSITINGSASGYIAVDTTKFLGIKFLKVVVADNQTGAKTLTLAIRPLL